MKTYFFQPNVMKELKKIAKATYGKSRVTPWVQTIIGQRSWKTLDRLEGTRTVLKVNEPRVSCKGQSLRCTRILDMQNLKHMQTHGHTSIIGKQIIIFNLQAITP